MSTISTIVIGGNPSCTMLAYSCGTERVAMNTSRLSSILSIYVVTDTVTVPGPFGEAVKLSV